MIGKLISSALLGLASPGSDNVYTTESATRVQRIDALGPEVPEMVGAQARRWVRCANGGSYRRLLEEHIAIYRSSGVYLGRSSGGVLGNDLFDARADRAGHIVPIAW